MRAGWRPAPPPRSLGFILSSGESEPRECFGSAHSVMLAQPPSPPLCRAAASDLTRLHPALFQDRVGRCRPPAVPVNRINVLKPSRAPDLTWTSQLSSSQASLLLQSCSFAGDLAPRTVLHMGFIHGLSPLSPPPSVHGGPRSLARSSRSRSSLCWAAGPVSGFESGLRQVLPRSLTATLLTSVCLCVPSCKMGIIRASLTGR